MDLIFPFWKWFRMRHRTEESCSLFMGWANTRSAIFPLWNTWLKKAMYAWSTITVAMGKVCGRWMTWDICMAAARMRSSRTLRWWTGKCTSSFRICHWSYSGIVWGRWPCALLQEIMMIAWTCWSFAVLQARMGQDLLEKQLPIWKVLCLDQPTRVKSSKPFPLPEMWCASARTKTVLPGSVPIRQQLRNTPILNFVALRLQMMAIWHFLSWWSVLTT